MTSPDIDNVRLVKFWHRGFGPSYFRAALYDDTGTLIFDSGQQNHIGVYVEGGTLWQEFPIDPPIDLPRNVPFGYGVKYEPVPPSTTCGFYTYFSYSGYPAGGRWGDCDQAYELTNEPTDTTVPFSLTVGDMSPVNHTVFYALSYALYPTVSMVTPAYLNDGQENIVISGAGFEGKDEFGAGTSKLWLTENNDWATPGIKVQQTDISWNNQSITFDASFGALTPGTTAYLWVENSDGQVNEAGYPVSLNIACPSPPLEVGGSLSVTPDDGAYIPATFTITEDFSDPDNTVYGCLYTIDDGAVWQLGTVSGTGPYTCTATDISSTDGTALTIRMKATSCGGTSTPDSSLTRTVDDAGPVSSLFTATPGDTQCFLEWSATDSGTGMHATEPYTIEWRTYNFSSCGYAPQLYSGTGTSINHTALENGRTYYYRLCMKDNYNVPGEAAVTCTLNATPWNVLNDGTSPGNSYATGLAENKAVSAFTLELTNGSVSDTDIITAFAVTGTNTANVSSVKIYRDDGTVANAYDSGDTLIATSSFSGDTAPFSGLNILTTDTPTQYIITYDIIPSPTHGQTLTAYISSITGQTWSVDNNDSVDATITVDTTTPSTANNVTATWYGTERTVTLSPSDTGSGVAAASGIYGCFGTGCTPTLLGSNTMTSSCGSGNTCEYEVRYYSIDRAGNTESIKTAANTLRIDREPPSGGSFSAFGGASPIVLHWENITDNGSGMNYYRLQRANGTVPPADCASGTQRYLGSATTFNDSYQISNGQVYSYRLCAYDKTGNIASDYVASATAGASCSVGIGCGNCHGMPAGSGSHDRHLPHDIWCDSCHREGGDAAHVDGNITIAFDSGWNLGPDIPFPQYWGGGSCGGPGNPVGGFGNPGCHGPTVTYPYLTSETVCYWEGGCEEPDFSDCSLCHGVPVGSGATGGDYDPGGHDVHMVVGDCMPCHTEQGPDPAHINNTIFITASGWNGPPDRTWPGPTGATCGGPGNPIACHTVGPVTPEWECFWDGWGACTDPAGP